MPIPPKPRKPEVLIEPLHSHHRVSERARGLPKVTQQYRSRAKARSQLSAPRFIIFQSQPLSMTCSDCDLEEVVKLFILLNSSVNILCASDTLD